MNKQRKRGFSVKHEGRILIEQKMRDKGYNRDKLAEVAEISIDTINSLVRGENKERKTIEAVARALDIHLTDIIDASELYPQVENTAKDDTNINWVQVCHKMLEEQQEQQRTRRKASAMGYEVNVHVPLGLVERKQQQRRNENVERKEIYQLESEVITKTYQHQDFLQEVINKGYQGKNKHIAIVGEPGAGKTTLLNAIASDIKDKNQKLPIFISLGSLQGMTLADYILKKWLPDAIRLINIVPTSEIEAQLQTEFYQGNFYLLLDGVDEMGESSPIQALNKISQELTNWLGQARVILTCRLNVWDATVNNNIIPRFNTFKTQEFNPEQVNTFIAEWFQVANNINGGKKLIAQLQEEGKERIRELVTNPLRLCLLCQIFDQNDQGELPETKAQFYEIFTRYFYEWKPELVPDLIKSYELKQELHQALGKLALAGINSDLRFRLKRSFAVKAMRDEKLFNLACEVGWLNQVDRDAVNDEDVYAFFHPNFQEYFAALVIDDWRYFLNHVSDNPDEGIYRVFEPKWKEVMLMWIGRKDIKTEDKESFMNTLMDISDNSDSICNYFYYEQPDFLGALLIVEFPDFSRSYEIVDNIVEYSFGYFDNQNQQWVCFPYFIAVKATEILPLTNISYVGNAIDNLIGLLLDAQEYIIENDFMELFLDMFWTLNKSAPNNDFVINQLTIWIKEGTYWHNEDYENPKILPYDEINTNNPIIIDQLSEMLVKSYNFILQIREKEKIKEEIRKNQVVNHNTNNLGSNDYQIYKHEYLVVEKRLNDLVGLDENSRSIVVSFKHIITTLARIAYNNQNILDLLINIIKKDWDNPNFYHDFCLELVIIIDEFKGNKQELIYFLDEKLADKNYQDNYRRCCIAEYLIKLQPESNIPINILSQSLTNIHDKKMSLRISEILFKTYPENTEILNTLAQLIPDKLNNNNRIINQKNISDPFAKRFSISIAEKAISCLAKMAKHSNSARIILDNVFQNPKYPGLQEKAALHILELEPNNQIALILLLHRYQNHHSHWITEEDFTNLLDNSDITNNLINILAKCDLEHSEDVNICQLVIKLLRWYTDETQELKIVKLFKNILTTTTDKNIIYEIAVNLGDLSIVNTVGYEDCKLEISEMLKNILKDNHDGETITAAVTSLGNIYPGNIDIMNRLLHKIKANKSEQNYISDLIEDRINKIAYQNTYFINHLIELFRKNNHYKNPLYINILSKISLGNFDTVQALINLMNNPKESENYWLIRKSLIQILKGNLFAVTVSGLKDRWINNDNEDKDILHILWHCAQNMTYPEFYRAWHGEPSPIQNLEKQFTDTHSHLSQLQPTEKTYPLTLNLKTLQNETDIIEISQEICNQIYFTACPENPEIPQINNAPQLKSKIPQIKKHLQTENLALIINNCEPNQEMIKFCNKLTDVLYIAFITEQPLDAPLKGFPNQPNLLNVIQHWINEI